MCAYLEQLGAMTALRVVFATMTLALGLFIPWVAMAHINVSHPLRIALGCASGIAGAAMTVMWATRVPTKRQSLAFVAVTQILTTLAVVPQPQPLSGLIGCLAFANLAAYIGFFHCAPAMLINFLFTVGCVGILTVRIAIAGQLGLALSAFCAYLGLNILFPLINQVAVHHMGKDAVSAETDPLTGLLNRRGFEIKTGELLAARSAADVDADVVAIAIDLDRFKTLNDTLGHAYGDRALVEVATTLRANTRETAILARVGGDEFVIVDILDAQQLPVLAQRLSDAVGALPHPITASVGTTVYALQDLSANPRSTVQTLVKAADTAMYAAKRAGGNHIRSAHIDTPHTSRKSTRPD